MKKIAFLFLNLLLNTFGFSQNILYVNQNSGGLENGESWANAFHDLSEALSVATAGDQVWVAAGVYYPTSDTNRTISFELKNGVSLYGGFSGNETALTDRDPGAFITRLSGNIGNPDLQTDNSIHVLIGRSLDATSTIDQLVISDGYSVQMYDRQSDPYGAGLLLLPNADLSDLNPVIRNCRFEKNHAGGSGGGLAIMSYDPDWFWFLSYVKNNPLIEGCDFLDNKAEMEAGALYKHGESMAGDTFKVIDCRFVNNYILSYWGGAVYLDYTLGSVMLFEACNFEKNYNQGGFGGAICWSADDRGDYTCSLIVRDCFFTENSATDGGAIALWAYPNSFENIHFELYLQRCIFEKNVARNSLGASVLAQNSKNQTIKANVTDCSFRDNRVNSYFDLGIVGYNEVEVEFRMDRCSFINLRHNSPSTGPAYAIHAGGKKSTSKITNCVFANNQSAIWGGILPQGQATREFINCTFYNNGKKPIGKRFYSDHLDPSSQSYNNMIFKNCIIWESQALPYKLFENQSEPPVTHNRGFYVTYSSFHGITAGQIPSASYVLGDSIYYNQYPEFADTSNLDFSIPRCSQVQNRGNNAFVEDLESDMAGGDRIRSGRVDLGAFEQPDSCFVSKVFSHPKEQELRLRILQSPSNGLTLDFECLPIPMEVARVQICDVWGRVLYDRMHRVENTVNTLTLPHLLSGNYWLIINLKNHVRKVAGFQIVK